MSIYNLEAINEKMSKLEYRKKAFKKKYNFVPDKNERDVGTITVDDKKHRVDMKNQGYIEDKSTGVKAPRQTSYILHGDDRKLVLDKNFFKVGKGSNKGKKSRDAILYHEIGHSKLHGSDADPDKRSTKVFKDVVTNIAKDSVGIDISDKNSASHKDRKDQYDLLGIKDYVAGTDKSKIKDREKSYNNAKKYETGRPHNHAYEYEADRYAANKTSEKALKSGLHNYYKLNNKEKNIKSQLKTTKKITKEMMPYSNIHHQYDPTKENVKMTQKEVKKKGYDDMKQREKALKDKDLKNDKLYK